jgi:hypothetical protein
VQEFVEHDGHCTILPQEIARGFSELREWKNSGIATAFGLADLSSARYNIISPCRMPNVTASVRLPAFSLVMIDVTWNLTVCSEMP